MVKTVQKHLKQITKTEKGNKKEQIERHKFQLKGNVKLKEVVV